METHHHTIMCPDWKKRGEAGEMLHITSGPCWCTGHCLICGRPKTTPDGCSLHPAGKPGFGNNPMPWDNDAPAPRRTT